MLGEGSSLGLEMGEGAERPAALDAVSANLSSLKTPTVLRLEDGTFY